MAASVNRVLGQLQRWTTAAQTADVSDAVLLERFIGQRDEAAFAALVARHGTMVLRVCRRIVGESHRAEDAFQAVFLVLARKASTLRQPEALAAWLYGVARRVALKARRQAERQRSSVSPLMETLPDPHPDPLTQLTARELLERIDEEVQRLPMAQRSAVLLCCLEGCPQEEAARRLGWTVASVKSHLQRGRKRLQDRLRRRGIDLSPALTVVSVSRGEAASALLLRSTSVAALNDALGTPAAALAHSVLKSMLWGKPAIMTALVLTMACVASSTLTVAYRTVGPLVGWVEERDPPSADGGSRSSTHPTPEAARKTDALGDPLPKGAIARLGTLRLRGSQGPIVFSPEGKYIVSAGGESGTQAVFWDRSTGRRVRALTVKGNVFRLVFSPDGKKLAAVGNGGFFNPVWDTASGKELFTFKGNEIAFSAEGKEIISTYPAFKGTTVRTFDASTGRQLTEWTLKHPSDSGFALSPDGRFAAAPLQDSDGRIFVIFDLTKRNEAKRLQFPQGKNTPLRFSGDSLRLIVGDQKGFGIWDWSSGKMLGRWEGRIRTPPGFSADGRRLAWTGADEGNVNSIWTADGEVGRPRSIRALTSDNWNHPPAFSPEGRNASYLNELSMRKQAKNRGC